MHLEVGLSIEKFNHVLSGNIQLARFIQPVWLSLIEYFPQSIF